MLSPAWSPSAEPWCSRRPASSTPRRSTITLLNINDFHGRIDPTNDLTTKWATTIEKERVTDPEALLLGAGDLIGASLFNSAIQQDQPTIDVMNEMCLNASSVGNHEFDQGYADLTDAGDRWPAGHATVSARARSPAPAARARNALWQYLGANVYQKGTQTPALPEYATFVVHGVTVGVVGAVTSETPALVSPGGITQIDIGDPVAAVNRVAEQLTDGNPANGEAQVLIAEFHEGAPNGSADLNANKARVPGVRLDRRRQQPEVLRAVHRPHPPGVRVQRPRSGSPWWLPTRSCRPATTPTTSARWC